MLLRLIPFYAAAFFGYMINGITSFAGNMFVIPFGFNTLGIDQSIVALNIMGFTSSLIVALTGFKRIIWREFAKMTIVMFAFMLVGMLINMVVSADILKIIFGIFVLSIGVYYLLRNEEKAKTPPEALLWGALVLGGVIQGMFVSGGPMAIVYALNKIKDKDEMRGTLGAMWTVLNASYLIILIIRGQVTLEIATIAVIGIPFIVVGTFLGTIIAKHIRQDIFLKIVYVLLILLGISMFIF